VVGLPVQRLFYELKEFIKVESKKAKVKRQK
jgi:hypothetical protein